MDDYWPVIAFSGIGKRRVGCACRRSEHLFSMAQRVVGLGGGSCGLQLCGCSVCAAGGEWYAAHKVVLATQSATLNELFLEQGPALWRSTFHVW